MVWKDRLETHEWIQDAALWRFLGASLSPSPKHPSRRPRLYHPLTLRFESFYLREQRRHLRYAHPAAGRANRRRAARLLLELGSYLRENLEGSPPDLSIAP